MVRKTLITTVVATLFGVSTANATVYKFAFDSFDAELTAAGQITVNAAGEVTGVSGMISGLANQTISAVTPNPNFSSTAYSPDGSFIYDNLYHASGMPSMSTVCCSSPLKTRAAIGTSGGIRPAITRSGSRLAATITRLRRAET